MSWVHLTSKVELPHPIVVVVGNLCDIRSIEWVELFLTDQEGYVWNVEIVFRRWLLLTPLQLLIRWKLVHHCTHRSSVASWMQ